jgi:hypothetical protein
VSIPPVRWRPAVMNLRRATLVQEHTCGVSGGVRPKPCSVPGSRNASRCSTNMSIAARAWPFARWLVGDGACDVLSALQRLTIVSRVAAPSLLQPLELAYTTVRSRGITPQGTLRAVERGGAVGLDHPHVVRTKQAGLVGLAERDRMTRKGPTLGLREPADTRVVARDLQVHGAR